MILDYDRLGVHAALQAATSAAIPL